MDIEETTQTPVDDFDNAFAQASGQPAADDKPATDAPTAVATDAPTDDKPATDAPAAVATDAPTDDKPATDAPAAVATDAPAAVDKPTATSAPAAEPTVEEQARQLGIDPKHLAQAIAEEQQRLAKSQEEPAAPTEPKVFAAEDFLAEDDKTAIAAFKKDWPTEFPAIERMILAHANAIAMNHQNSLVAQLNKVLAPIVQSVGRSEVNAHVSTIKTAHPDYDVVLPKVREWVAAQPSFMRSAMENVLKNGNAAEVVDLVSVYKGASVTSGAAPVQPASTAAAQEAPKPAPVSPAAVAATAAVPPAARTKQTTANDPGDFDGAFAEASVALLSS